MKHRKCSKIRIKRQIDKSECMKNRNIKYKKYKKWYRKQIEKVYALDKL